MIPETIFGWTYHDSLDLSHGPYMGFGFLRTPRMEWENEGDLLSGHNYWLYTPNWSICFWLYFKIPKAFINAIMFHMEQSLTK